MGISQEVDIIIVICSILIRTYFLLIDKVLEKIVIYSLFLKKSKVHETIFHDFFNEGVLIYRDFAIICNDVWRTAYNFIVIDSYYDEIFDGKIRFGWDDVVL